MIWVHKKNLWQRYILRSCYPDTIAFLIMMRNIWILKTVLSNKICPASCGASLLCPQKQCLSWKEDGLSGRTNQRLPCVKGADAEGGWGIVLRKTFAFTIPPSCFASHLPLHKGGFLPPDSIKKEYEQNAPTPFVSRQVNLLYERHPLRVSFLFWCDSVGIDPLAPCKLSIS